MQMHLLSHAKVVFCFNQVIGNSTTTSDTACWEKQHQANPTSICQTSQKWESTLSSKPSSPAGHSGVVIQFHWFFMK